ncbi:MAG TPA: hypothetical protein PLX25_05535, partial [Sphaerochaeta sp.]|nr:hypothetical protein [Sphaerochaeta sp.]
MPLTRSPRTSSRRSAVNLKPDAKVVLEVKDLQTYFKTDAGIVKAVDGVSFKLHEGETLGIVG